MAETQNQSFVDKQLNQHRITDNKQVKITTVTKPDESISIPRVRLQSGEPEKLKSILKQSLGLDPSVSGPQTIFSQDVERRLSSMTLEMLMEHEEIDIHPFGRGGIYEGILYRRKRDEPIDMLAVLIWIIFVGSIVMMAVGIAFVSELYHFLKSEINESDRVEYCNFFKSCQKKSY